MTLTLNRRAFFARTATLGAGLAAASILPTLPARAAIPPSIVTLQQKSSGRFLDAWDDGSHDWFAVTRPAQNNASQQWKITWDDSGTGSGTIQQLSSGRFLDAHEIDNGLDFHMLTRPRQTFDQTQYWHVNSVGGGLYTLQQASSGRYADAHEYAEKDWGVVTRPAQNNPTQQWVLKFLRNG